jgi:hypothetical protein
LTPFQFISVVVMVLGGVVIAWWVIRPWYDFLIVVEEGEVSFKGRFPPEKQAAMVQFFSSDLGLPGRFRVIGRWRPRRILELKFKGDFPRFYEQRVRNFLAMTLRSGG